MLKFACVNYFNFFRSHTPGGIFYLKGNMTTPAGVFSSFFTHGYYHWHYRPFNSLSRSDFVNFLRAEQFDRLDHSSECCKTGGDVRPLA